MTARGHKRLLTAPIHGHDEKRRTEVEDTNKAFRAFMREMRACIKSRTWAVKEIYNVVDEERLRMVEGRFNGAGNSEGYEVRGFCLPDAFPLFTSLVVGDADVFIGLDDTTYYGVRAGIHVRSREAAELAREYFECLWNDRRAFKLRTHESNPEQFEKFRAAILGNMQKERP